MRKGGRRCGPTFSCWGFGGAVSPPTGSGAEPRRQTHSGMPNLRKNPFSTDFDHLFQSTEFFLFMAESTDFFLLGSATTPPPHVRLAGFRAA